MFKIENKESNYLAKIVKLGQAVKHPNADKLQGFVIDFNRVWTDMSYKEGNVVVYFPLECQLNPELLSYLNLYQHSELNQDKEKKGYFTDSGRVKAIKLRGEPSEGIVLTMQCIYEWLNFKTGVKNIDYHFNLQFDSFDDIWICKKYVPKFTKQQGEPNQQKSKNKVKITSLIGEGQFHLHRNTPKLKDNLHQIQPDDIISITDKWHGTSAVFSNVIVKRQLSWFEKFLLWCGIKIQTEKYGLVYSSRTVVKDVDGIKQAEGRFYNVDIWGVVNKELEGKILKGITLYGEIVGYLPTGKGIQGQYDYGCSIGQHEFRVYRITSTNPDGLVTEYSWQMIKDYCEKYGLLHVPEFYYGKASYFEKGVDYEKPFDEQLLDHLTVRYLEQDCKVCKNKVPAEGIVVRVEKGDCNAYKLKSFRFLHEVESPTNDSNILNIEDAN